ncbi:hypothetical protein AX16_008318 [Volvariella volvacea WC 439]|nr:hypothetical protein AX16_008318 [Volvariella volvacea WC 439]
MASVDYSLPLATLLRDATHEAHDTVAKSPGATALLSGKLVRDEYIRYLMMLWYIYDTLERALDQHAAHPTLEPTSNSSLLARAAPLAADISYLLQVPESSWKEHPIHQELVNDTPQALKDYVGRLEDLSRYQDPTPLLAHSYVRYLGDLSGGQTIRHILAKAYDLDESSGLGLAFYAFRELTSQKLANQGEMKRIKEWFRDGMNKAGDGKPEVKAAVLAETTRAFELNTELFKCIRIPEEQDKKVEDAEKPIVIDLEQPSTESTYSIASFAALITAVCLAHFILVVGGFTGQSGYQKLLAFEEWFDRLWGSR